MVSVKAKLTPPEVNPGMSEPRIGYEAEHDKSLISNPKNLQPRAGRKDGG